MANDEIIIGFGDLYTPTGGGPDYVVTDQRAQDMVSSSGQPEPYIGSAQVISNNPQTLAGAGSEPVSSVGTINGNWSLDEVAQASARHFDPAGKRPDVVDSLRDAMRDASQTPPQTYKRRQ